MKFLDFFKRRNVVINTTEIEKDKPTVIKLSKTILKTLSVCDIIYAELSEGDGWIMFYIIKEDQLIRYETNFFKDESTYMQAQKILFKHSGLKDFPSFGDLDKQTEKRNSKSQFNYYYGGMGNHVLENKNVFLEVEIIDKHFVYKTHNKEYYIYSSCSGVFNCVAYAMLNTE